MGELHYFKAFHSERRIQALEQRIEELLSLLPSAPETTPDILRLRNEIWLIESEFGDTASSPGFAS